MAEDWDYEEAGKYDYVRHNAQAVNDPTKVRTTELARDLHDYRYDPCSKHPRNAFLFYQTELHLKNTADSGAVRQCNCHQELEKHMDNQELRSYISLRRNKYHGINSQCFNSIEACTDMRLKPRHSIERAY